MLTAKVLPPNQLPPKDLTQTKFNIWAAEIQAWLAAVDTNAKFLPGGLYRDWQSEEQNPHRVAVVAPGDPDLPAEPTAQQRAAILDKRRRQCKVFVSLVAKGISENHYLEITRHATLLTWISNLIKRDYDLKLTRINFLNIADIKYDAETMTLTTYY